MPQDRDEPAGGRERLRAGQVLRLGSRALGSRTHPGLCHRRPALRHHEGVSWPSRVFLSGQAVSLLGDGLAVLAIPLLVLGLTRSPLISALSAASTTLGYLAVGLPAGVLVDRLDAWRVLVVTDATRAVAFAGLYLLWVTGAARLWVIMTIALAAGAASVFFETALVIVVKD